MKLRIVGDNAIVKEDLVKFNNRDIKARDIFYIDTIDKVSAYEFVRKFHYLENAKFFCVYAYGLFHKRTQKLLGVATYSNPQGISALKGWFGETNQNKDILELSRLCMLPRLNGSNATSFLLGNSVRLLHTMYSTKAVITLADSSRHVGSIYQVCNFKYYGLTNSKTDFYADSGKVNPRGSTKDVRGVWLPRTRKHRYAYVMDKSLEVLYQETTRPKLSDTTKKTCCNGKHIVYDNRFNEWYTCPICCDEFKRVDVD